MTQVDRALAALTNRWLGPHELTDVSGRANPEGLRRDARAAAYHRGFWWHEKRVLPAEGRAYKACMVTIAPLPAEMRAGVTTYEPLSWQERQASLTAHLARTSDILDEMRARADSERQRLAETKPMELFEEATR